MTVNNLYLISDAISAEFFMRTKQQLWKCVYIYFFERIIHLSANKNKSYKLQWPQHERMR